MVGDALVYARPIEFNTCGLTKWHSGHSSFSDTQTILSHIKEAGYGISGRPVHRYKTYPIRIHGSTVTSTTSTNSPISPAARCPTPIATVSSIRWPRPRGPRPGSATRWAIGSPFPPTAPGKAVRTTPRIKSPALVRHH